MHCLEPILVGAFDGWMVCFYLVHVVYVLFIQSFLKEAEEMRVKFEENKAEVNVCALMWCVLSMDRSNQFIIS